MAIKIGKPPVKFTFDKIPEDGNESEKRPNRAWLEWIEQAQSILESTAQSGITANRPEKKYISQTYFDTTLGHPIWFDGTNWVDATGATV